jgi:hypothetical protein
VKRVPQLLTRGTPHGWFMFGLVESRWGGRQNSLLWYEVCRRSVACLICGSVKHVRLQDAKWNWMLAHERYHIEPLEPEKVAAAEALFCMQLPSFPEAVGMIAARSWKPKVQAIMLDVFGEIPKPQRELVFQEAL